MFNNKSEFNVGDKVRLDKFSYKLEIDEDASYIVSVVEDDGKTIKLEGLTHWYRVNLFSLITSRDERGE